MVAPSRIKECSEDVFPIQEICKQHEYWMEVLPQCEKPLQSVLVQEAVELRLGLHHVTANKTNLEDAHIVVPEAEAQNVAYPRAWTEASTRSLVKKGWVLKYKGVVAKWINDNLASSVEAEQIRAELTRD